MGIAAGLSASAAVVAALAHLHVAWQGRELGYAFLLFVAAGLAPKIRGMSDHAPEPLVARMKWYMGGLGHGALRPHGALVSRCRDHAPERTPAALRCDTRPCEATAVSEVGAQPRLDALDDRASVFAARTAPSIHAVGFAAVSVPARPAVRRDTWGALGNRTVMEHIANDVASGRAAGVTGDDTDVEGCVLGAHSAAPMSVRYTRRGRSCRVRRGDAGGGNTGHEGTDDEGQKCWSSRNGYVGARHRLRIVHGEFELSAGSVGFRCSRRRP